MRLKYDYVLKDSQNKPFSRVGDSLDIMDYLKRINGVYYKLAWVLQINNITKETKEFLVHQNNGFIHEVCIMYKNGKKIN